MLDIEIANNAQLKNIKDIYQESFGNNDNLDLYGKYMCKLPLDLIDEEKIQKSHLILVTSINPTKSGIGKTTVSIGLNDAFRKLNKNSIAVLREPSLGPCFGMKGGACGGGYSQVVPMDKINLHFTGDFHAITTANNMIAAAIDNYFYHNPQEFGKVKKITFRRCLDINDRSLRTVYTKDKFGNLIETGFDITPASEIMAIFCLSKDIEDLRKRIDKIIIAECLDGSFMYCSILGITGSIVALLSEAIKPNMVQSLENNPVIIHGGPFANIAHGCNSVIATKTGMCLSDYVITEAGFGSDLGAEKFIDIKCRNNNILPECVVVVITIKGLKNLGNDKTDNIDKLIYGFQNLNLHIEWLQKHSFNVIVTCNKFESDTKDEIDTLNRLCKENNITCIENSCFKDGGDGCINLAKYIIDNIVNVTYFKRYKEEHYKEYHFNNFVYNLFDPIKQKIEKVCQEVYNIKYPSKIKYSKQAQKFLDKYDRLGSMFYEYPICIAKTQYSLTDEPNIIPIPYNDTEFHIDEIKVNNGAEFLVIIAGNMMRMPGLPKEPAAKHIDYINGKITGLS